LTLSLRDGNILYLPRKWGKRISVMNIYVGNLPFTASEDEVRQAFAAYGTVSSVAIIKDRETGQSRGFAFVEMPNNEEGTAAINNLNGKPLKGRALKVNEARPREESFGGGGGGHRSGGFGGGGGGGGRREGGFGGGGGDRFGGDRDRRGGTGGGGRRSW
jgi:RNA recognition motif-containing protein